MSELNARPKVKKILKNCKDITKDDIGTAEHCIGRKGGISIYGVIGVGEENVKLSQRFKGLDRDALIKKYNIYGEKRNKIETQLALSVKVVQNKGNKYPARTVEKHKKRRDMLSVKYADISSKFSEVRRIILDIEKYRLALKKIQKAKKINEKKITLENNFSNNYNMQTKDSHKKLPYKTDLEVTGGKPKASSKAKPTKTKSTKAKPVAKPSHHVAKPKASPKSKTASKPKTTVSKAKPKATKSKTTNKPKATKPKVTKPKVTKPKASSKAKPKASSKSKSK